MIKLEPSQKTGFLIDDDEILRQAQNDIIEFTFLICRTEVILF